MMKTTLASHPSWAAQIEEVSAGADRLIAVHASGAKIELTGTDPGSLLKNAEDSAGQIEEDLRQKSLNQI
jgi:hypothetical protein